MKSLRFWKIQSVITSIFFKFLMMMISKFIIKVHLIHALRFLFFHMTLRFEKLTWISIQYFTNKKRWLSCERRTSFRSLFNLLQFLRIHLTILMLLMKNMFISISNMSLPFCDHSFDYRDHFTFWLWEDYSKTSYPLSPLFFCTVMQVSKFMHIPHCQ